MNISSKFLCPHFPGTMLHRERLVQVLIDATSGNISVEEKTVSHYKFILFYTPAGYGKTTVIADFVRHTNLHCCWYFLDATDIDRLIFLQRLISSLRCCFPQFGQALETQIITSVTSDGQNKVSDHHFEMLIDSLIQAISTEIQQPFVFILSNYHAVNSNKYINRLVSHLLHHLPSHCIIIMESRTIPDLECEDFLLQQELLVLGKNKLLFTAQEVWDLATIQGITQMENEDVAHLTTYFEGWITGILLGTSLSDIQFLSSTTGHWNALNRITNRENILRYVMHEIFDQEHEMYDFLCEMSILPNMIPDICNQLLDSSNAHERLHYIEKQGLFVTSAKNADGSFYFCHPVLRDLFYTELHEQNPQRFRALNLQASTLFQQRGDQNQAIFYALEAQDYPLAARIISQTAKNILIQGQSEIMTHYIDALPSLLLESSSHILLIRANSYLMEYKTDSALVLLEKAFAVNQSLQSESEAKEILSAEILITQSIAFFHSGEYVQAKKLCNQALHLLPLEERVQRALAYQRMSLCTSIMGDCNQGIIELQQALQLWGHHTINRQTAFLYGQLAKMYNMLGNYSLAEHSRVRAISYWDQLGDIEGKINNLIGLGVTYFHQGTYAEAETILKQALALSRTHHFPRREAYALINLGELYQEQNNYKNALTSIEDGFALARHYQDSYLTNYALCSLAMTFFLMDDAQTALLLLSEVDLKTSKTLSYEGCFLELIRGTVFLYQHRYEEAYACLNNLVSITHQAGWKRRQIQVIMRLAACQLALEQHTLATQTIEKVVKLAQLGKYEHLVQVELNHLQALKQVIQMSPPQNREEKEQKILSHHSQNIWNIQISQPYLRTRALGTPIVLLDNRHLTHWRMKTAIELYFFLLDKGCSVHKEKIIAALWPDANEQVDQTFRSTVHYLRKAIGNACVIHRSGTYELNLQILYGDHIWYDVTAFKGFYAQAKDSLLIEDKKQAKDSFQEMVALYQGDYVQSFYNDWCRLQREELLHMYMDALTHLAHITWNFEQIEESFHYWQKMLEIENLREDAHYGIMRYYIHQGKRTQALRHYQQYEESLHNELSAKPGPIIQKLRQSIV